MALLRNLRNILNVCSADIIKKVADRISNKEQVEKSKQFPFRFFSAFRELQENNNPMTSIILQAIDVACGYSIKNLKLNGVSFIASDVSGSMQTNLSTKSKIQYIDIGLVMQGLAKKISPLSITGIFGDTFKIKNYTGNSVFEPVLNYKEGEVGYSTNGYLTIKYLNDNNIKVDNILLFTDCEMYGGDIQTELSKYKNSINQNVKVFIFNLAGYKTIQFPEYSVYTIGGWSDKVFDYIEATNFNIKKIC
jgi:60 kDa SS-A/Ro ribonucleoprotein